MQPAHKSSFTARFPSFLQKSRAGQIPCAGFRCFPLFCDKSNGLAPFFQFAPGIKHAGFLGNQHLAPVRGPSSASAFLKARILCPLTFARCSTPRPRTMVSIFSLEAFSPSWIWIHARIWLVARHGRGSVVQNDKQQIVAIVNRICKAGDARMKNVESPMKPTTILPDALAKPLPELAEEPMQTRKIRAFQRWQKAKRVTANVAGIQGRIAKSLP